jgi:hypothetical protein
LRRIRRRQNGSGHTHDNFLPNRAFSFRILPFPTRFQYGRQTRTL